ncbi:MAG: hypothetical protein AB1411_07145 [Nitrospirota bacterium]
MNRSVDRLFRPSLEWLAMLQMVSFKQISQILELTDRLGLSREWVEIPLSPASPGLVHKLANGKIEIVVDAEVPFDQWLTSLEPQIRQVAGR